MQHPSVASESNMETTSGKTRAAQTSILLNKRVSNYLQLPRHPVGNARVVPSSPQQLGRHRLFIYLPAVRTPRVLLATGIGSTAGSLVTPFSPFRGKKLIPRFPSGNSTPNGATLPSPGSTSTFAAKLVLLAPPVTKGRPSVLRTEVLLVASIHAI